MKSGHLTTVGSKCIMLNMAFSCASDKNDGEVIHRDTGKETHEKIKKEDNGAQLVFFPCGIARPHLCIIFCPTQRSALLPDLIEKSEDPYINGLLKVKCQTPVNSLNYTKL